MRAMLSGLALLFLFGCSHQQTKPHTVTSVLPQTSTQWFKALSPQPKLEQLFYLNPEQQQHFLQYFHSPAQSHYSNEYRLYNYLQHKIADFSYEGKNYPAEQALEKLQGNCMTLALLTSALAQLAGIETGYRVIYQEPMIDYDQNIFISSNHIRTYLYKTNPAPEQGILLLQRAALVIDYFPEKGNLAGDEISAERFYAMLYNNLAADALLSGKTDNAFHLSQKALSYDASFTPSINMIALMYHRKGALAEAAAWFDYGMQQRDSKITLLTNYRDFALKTHDHQLLEKINQQLTSNDDDNPYVWLALAIDAERSQQPQHAQLYYKKLLEKAPYLHNANLALVRLYLKENNVEAAQELIEQAMSYAYDPQRLQLYQTKLTALQRHRQSLTK
jgi:Tfp pilus assembly protein PilF